MSKDPGYGMPSTGNDALPIPTETPYTIRDKLQTLSRVDQFDASFIRNLPWGGSRIKIGHSIDYIAQLGMPQDQEWEVYDDAQLELVDNVHDFKKTLHMMGMSGFYKKINDTNSELTNVEDSIISWRFDFCLVCVQGAMSISYSIGDDKKSILWACIVQVKNNDIRILDGKGKEVGFIENKNNPIICSIVSIYDKKNAEFYCNGIKLNDLLSIKESPQRDSFLTQSTLTPKSDFYLLYSSFMVKSEMTVFLSYEQIVTGISLPLPNIPGVVKIIIEGATYPAGAHFEIINGSDSNAELSGGGQLFDGKLENIIDPYSANTYSQVSYKEGTTWTVK